MKSIITAVVIVSIVGAITYLESLKVSKKSSGDVVEIVTTAGQTDSMAIKNEVNKKEDTKNTKDAKDTNSVKEDRSSLLTEKVGRYEPAKEITTPDGFINTDNLLIADEVGKNIVLVDFWTYSCINCQRTLPYLNAWHEKYGDKGLTIIGVHTPEFEFEKEYDNVLRATEKFGVRYPVVLDNDYSTWSAYRNRYWPRKYLIDIDGFIVYDHIGEGGYEETERKIQELLTERQNVLGLENGIDKTIITPEGVEKTNVFTDRSPEIYFGAWRNDSLGNGVVRSEGIQQFSAPDNAKPNTLYFDGEWDIDKEFAQNISTPAKIIFKYKAEKVFMVASSENGVRAKLLIDGKPIGSRGGADVSSDGFVDIKGDSLYRLVEDPNGSGEHLLEIIIEGTGLKAFTFTFG